MGCTPSERLERGRFTTACVSLFRLNYPLISPLLCSARREMAFCRPLALKERGRAGRTIQNPRLLSHRAVPTAFITRLNPHTHHPAVLSVIRRGVYCGPQSPWAEYSRGSILQQSAELGFLLSRHALCAFWCLKLRPKLFFWSIGLVFKTDFTGRWGSCLGAVRGSGNKVG